MSAEKYLQKHTYKPSRRTSNPPKSASTSGVLGIAERLEFKGKDGATMAAKFDARTQIVATAGGAAIVGADVQGLKDHLPGTPIKIDYIHAAGGRYAHKFKRSTSVKLDEGGSRLLITGTQIKPFLEDLP